MEWLEGFLFGFGDYAFWLIVVSAFCFLLERLFPWRKEQRALRSGFAQDLFWLAFNGHIFWVPYVIAAAWLWDTLGVTQLFGHIEAVALLHSAPVWGQFVVLLVLKDFLEWNVHRLLHRVPWLWEFHKVHHSIEELDWVGYFRFHWMELLVYGSLTYVPLAMLGVDGRVWLPLGIFSALIGYLNHSNLNLSWGPLRYVLNSPRFHVWHHDIIVQGGYGRNFAIIFSAWDWVFRTAQMPAGQPAWLGFEGMEQLPRGLLGRFTWPLAKLLTAPASPSSEPR